MAGAAGGQAQEGSFTGSIGRGRDIWLRGSCSPSWMNRALVQVIEYTMDLTEQKQLNANFEGQLNALSRVMGKVEFSLDGIILDANARFLETVGYQLEELKGQHHRLLVDPDYAQSADYRSFWETLRRGEFLAGEFCRIGKQGKRSDPGPYNPVLISPANPARSSSLPPTSRPRWRSIASSSAPWRRPKRLPGCAELHVAAGDVDPGHPIWDGSCCCRWWGSSIPCAPPT